jgi:hypothetical protein
MPMMLIASFVRSLSALVSLARTAMSIGGESSVVAVWSGRAVGDGLVVTTGGVEVGVGIGAGAGGGSAPTMVM